MAFISAKERNKNVEKISRSYKFRKFFISINIILLIAFIVMLIVSILIPSWKLIDTSATSTDKITTTGIIFVSIGSCLLVMSFISLILTITIRDPNQTVKVVNKLRSSAIGGKQNSSNSSQNVADRLKAEKKPKKSK